MLVPPPSAGDTTCYHPDKEYEKKEQGCTRTGIASIIISGRHENLCLIWSDSILGLPATSLLGL
jgi:hypothetical protein